MSEQNVFDFGDFEVSRKANYQKEPAEKVKEPKPLPPYNVKFNFKKKKIVFDSTIAKEIDLANNSLAHAPSFSKGQMAIIVVPGRAGLFGKGQQGSEKGNAFKNRKLAEDLVALNLTSGKYKMEKVGEGPAKIRTKTVEGCQWYLLNMIGEPQQVDLSNEESAEEAETQEGTNETFTREQDLEI